MSIHKITEDNFEFFTIDTNPSKSFSSRIAHDASGSRTYFTGSGGNIDYVLDNTGSVYLYANRSAIEKDTIPVGLSARDSFEDQSFEQLRRNIVQKTGTDIEGDLTGYLTEVTNTSSSLRKQTKIDILRFIPTFNFSSNTIRKNLVINHLMPYYRVTNPSSNFGFTNFNSLNFWRSSSLSTDFTTPNNSAILYPNPSGSLIVSGVHDSNYGIQSGSAFSFEFWYKPSFTTETESEEFHAGTVLQLSSSYAISILSGSSKDVYGRPNKFKLMVQFGSGSGLGPSQDIVNAGNELTGVFVSNDNALELNKWHHVVIRNGGSNYNNSSGSFVVNGVNKGNFHYHNNGLGLYDVRYVSASASPSVLSIGNFYEGGISMEPFFNANAALRDGLLELTSEVSEPINFSFNHPLQGELHDVRIYNKYLTNNDIQNLLTGSPATYSNVLFNLPPFFTEESPYRQFVGTHGGEPITPFFERNGTTKTPFAADMAFSAGGHYPNLENYVRDFVTNNYPRLYNLTGSSITPGNSVVQSANDYLYTSGANAGACKKRLYTILPCDHGGFQPNFGLLSSMSGAFSGRYDNDLGNAMVGHVSLRNIVSSSADLTSRTILASGSNSSMLNDVLGIQPETGYLNAATTASYRGNPGTSLTMMHRLRDNSSNQVVFFDISNLFYGKSIKPGSVVITNNYLSGTDNRFGMVLKDDGIGNIYRADTTSDQCTWNSVGNIFYPEGLIIIKHPNLFFFGENGFDISFKGEQSIHVKTITAYARVQELISSSNPGYEKIDINDTLANEPDQNFVYITGINIHDENMNVIMKSVLAQPVMKKSGDKMAFKIRMDW